MYAPSKKWHPLPPQWLCICFISSTIYPNTNIIYICIIRNYFYKNIPLILLTIWKSGLLFHFTKWLSLCECRYSVFAAFHQPLLLCLPSYTFMSECIFCFLGSPHNNAVFQFLVARMAQPKSFTSWTGKCPCCEVILVPPQCSRNEEISARCG
jgi:hypothetical protein